VNTGHYLTGLIKFAGREEWRPHFEEVLGEHIGPAEEEFNLDFEGIGQALDDQWAMIPWGCAFEDFLTRSVGHDKTNLVDVYLKRRGWRERPPAKAYMNALRASVMSLYETSEIVPGESFLARDLIRVGEPIWVSERTATKTLKPWDRIAARLLSIGESRRLAGGLLPFSLGASSMLLKGMAKATKKKGASASQPLDDERLRRAAPLFTIAQLFDVLPRAVGAVEPALQNSDGEEVVFHEVRFPLAAGVTPGDVGTRLDTVSNLQRENDGFWNWLRGTAQKRPISKVSKTISWNVIMENGATVLGNVELKGGILTLSVNSANRAARGKAILSDALGKLVRSPLTEIQTVDQMRRSRKGEEGLVGRRRRRRPCDARQALSH
jgi:hypothetical protein